ncbi:MAG: lipopolysaccharide heptosyltransferase II [Gemmatimonadota bacterium]
MAAPAPAPSGGGTLVVQTAFLGDVILTTGLLSALAERLGPVDVLVRPAAAALIEKHPAVRSVITYDKRGQDRGTAGFTRVAERLRLRQYSRAYLPHGSFRSALLARWAGIGERIGFDDASGAWLYTVRVNRPHDVHEAERLLALARPRKGTKATLALHLTEDDRAVAYAWLAARGIGDGFVALAPGSVWGTKRWPGYADLARMLPGRVVVIGGPEDRDLAQNIVTAAPDRVVSAAGDVSLRVSAALIERAAVLVTNDSAPLHMASAIGTPVVAIFGPTSPGFGFGPRGDRVGIVEHGDLTCRPCSPHGPMRCPLGHHRCMREITAVTVRGVVEALTT